MLAGKSHEVSNGPNGPWGVALRCLVESGWKLSWTVSDM